MRKRVGVTWRSWAVPSVAVVALALFLAGCGGGDGSTGGAGAAQPERGGTLTLAQRGEVISLEPLAGIDIASAHVISQIVEPLFETDPDGKVVPLLVKSFETSADNLTWTFHLRDGIVFSDGKPLTSADVVFTLEEARKNEYWGGLLEPVKSVEATSPTTVVVKTSESMPALVSVLSVPNLGIVPKDYGGVTVKQYGENPIGSGPFVLANWKRGSSLTLDRNPDYWQQGRPYLDKLVIETVQDDNSRISQLRGGQLDVIEEPPPAQLAGLENVPGVTAEKYAYGSSAYLVLNLEDPLFADPRVRQAVGLAIDRQSMVDAVYSGVGKPAGSWLPPNLAYWDSSIAPEEQDLAEAKKLLAEAVKEGVDPSFDLLVPSDETATTTASQILQQDLEEVGFEVQLQPRDGATVLAVTAEKEFDVYLMGVYSTIGDPSELVNYYMATEGLYSGAVPPKLTKLAQSANTEPDPDKRAQLYAEWQQELAAERAIVTLDYRPFVWARQDSVVGLEINATGTPILTNAGFSG